MEMICEAFYSDVDKNLFEAIAEDNTEALTDLLNGDNYVNINLKTARMETPLILAAKDNKLALVEIILNNKNTHINSQNIFGDTALHLAVRNNHLEVATRILQDWRTCINTENNNKERVIHLVCSKGHVELFYLLVSFRDLQVHVRDILQYTPVMYVMLKLYEQEAANAPTAAHAIWLHQLLDRGGVVEIPEILDESDIPVLYPYFLHHNRFNSNANVNKRYSLFSYACHTGNVALFKALCQVPEFQRLNHADNVLIALQHAHIPMCIELLKAEYVGTVMPEAFRTLAHDDDLIELLDYVLDAAGMVSVEQILVKAAYYKRFDVINHFMPRATDPMVMYIMTHFKSMFYYITDHFPLNAHMKDTKDNTLLNLAVQYNYSACMVKKLLRLGVDPNVPNVFRKKPLYYCMDNHIDVESMNLLLPVTTLEATEIFNFLNMFVFVEKNQLVHLFKKVDWHTVYGPGLRDMPIYTFMLLVEFLKTLDQPGRHKMMLNMMGGSHARYIHVRRALESVSLLHSHNTTDIYTLDDINPCNRLEIVQYGPPIQHKYRTLTHTTLLHLIQSHEKPATYLKHVTDPFDRTALFEATVYGTGEPLFLDCLIRTAF